MADLPDGTVTLLSRDVDHSTEMVKRLQDRYGEVLARHRGLLRAAFAAHGGTEVDTQRRSASAPPMPGRGRREMATTASA
jgi:hypothetical protein